MNPPEKGRATRGLRVAAPYLVLTAIVLAVYADPLLTGRVFFYRDLGLMMRSVLLDARVGPAGHAEILPLWTHALQNGRPLVANPGYSLLEPLALLFPVLPFDLAFNLFLVLHVAIAGCAMVFLARSLGCSRVASFAGGAAYALGGGLVSALTLYWTVVAAAWAPLVIAAGLTAVKEPTPRRVALLAVAVGLQATGGQPEPIAATFLVGIILSLVWAAGPAGRRVLLVFGTWIGGVLAGLALAAPQLLPAALHARTTLRSMGFTTEGVLFNSLHPLRALWLVVPGLGGNPIDARKPGGFPGAALLDGSSPYLLSIYLGIVAVVLALVGLVLARRLAAIRPLAFTLAGLAIFGVVLASGRYLPGASALVRALPFPIPFRFAEKALYVTFLAVPPLAALGIDGLRRFGVLRLPVLLAAAVVLDLVLAHRGYTPTIDVADLKAPPLARELADRSHALGILEGTWRVHHQRQRSSGGWGPPQGSIPQTEEDFYRWQVRMLVPPGGAPYRIHAAMDLASDLLDDTRYFTIVRAAYNGSPQAWALSLGEAGVLWVVSPESDLEATTSGILVREIALGPNEGVPPGSGYVYRNTRFLPRARLAEDVSLMAAPSTRDLATMARQRYDVEAPWPPPTVIEAEHEANLPARDVSSGGSIDTIAEDHRGLTLSVTVSHPGVLVVSDVPGEIRAWRARVDDRPRPVWRANLAYLAVPVERGQHEIRLDYRPPGFRPGVLIMLVALSGCVAAWVWRSPS